jgi:hypothetical protein
MGGVSQAGPPEQRLLHHHEADELRRRVSMAGKRSGGNKGDQAE